MGVIHLCTREHMVMHKCWVCIWVCVGESLVCVHVTDNYPLCDFAFHSRPSSLTDTHRCILYLKLNTSQISSLNTYMFLSNLFFALFLITYFISDHNSRLHISLLLAAFSMETEERSCFLSCNLHPLLIFICLILCLKLITKPIRHPIIVQL